VPGKTAIELEAATPDDADTWGCALEDVCSMLAVSLYICVHANNTLHGGNFRNLFIHVLIAMQATGDGIVTQRSQPQPLAGVQAGEPGWYMMAHGRMGLYEVRTSKQSLIVCHNQLCSC
jgi:hypothetical protein